MSIDPAIFRVLVAQGATPEMLLAVVEAAAAAEEENRAKKRAGNAERQARFRARHNANNALPCVTERDDAKAPTLDKETVPPDPPKEINPTRGVCDTHAHEDAIGVTVFARLAANRLAVAVLLQMIADARDRHIVSTAAAVWNAMAKRAGLSPIKAMTDERRKRLRARLAEHGPDAFTEAIDAVERSSFCRGESQGGWRADFDFLLQPSSFTKLIEGSYDRASRNRGTGRTAVSGREDPIFAARRNLGRDDFAGMESA